MAVNAAHEQSDAGTRGFLGYGYPSRHRKAPTHPFTQSPSVNIESCAAGAHVICDDIVHMRTPTVAGLIQVGRQTK